MSADPALVALVGEFTKATTKHLNAHLETDGESFALAMAFGTLAGSAAFLHNTIGAAEALKALDGYAKPLRDLLAGQVPMPDGMQ